MSLARLAAAAPLLLTLAACGGDSASTKPAPSPPAASVALTASPAAPRPAAPTPAGPRPSAPVPASPKLAAAPAKLVAPLIGTWAADLGNCRTGAISISRTEFSGTENACTITAFGDNGDGTVTAALDCLGEGERATERIRMNPVFAPSGEGIVLTHLDRDNAEVTVLRCTARAATR